MIAKFLGKRYLLKKLSDLLAITDNSLKYQTVADMIIIAMTGGEKEILSDCGGEKPTAERYPENFLVS